MQLSHRKWANPIFIVIFTSNACEIYSATCKPSDSSSSIDFLTCNRIQPRRYTSQLDGNLQLLNQKSMSLTYLPFNLLVVEPNNYIHNEHADRVKEDDKEAIHPLWCVVKLIVIIPRFDEGKANAIRHCLFNSASERIHSAKGV